ncbi:flagellar protein FlhE [Kushneria phosphatilytica]|uniref:Flagellar protein FlhE n=1 Tax=Kushneria phosphatilytica TaxID=657387 RepID=A0A1S1NS12_9GAMM|nr:flagellar protein FlhE [Kushneria phosphatilytica]OHV12029.1 hypothetical protein BH688_05020 [Kushneria phosphatilytica]QEL11222.1 flagellar protein FlhE [Kushneria phosphatilytica]
MNACRSVGARSRGGLRQVTLVLLSLLPWSSVSAAVGGAWVGDGQVPVLRHAGHDYQLTLTPPATLPASRVGTVSWRYELSPLNTHLQTVLCHRQRCLPLSAVRGQTQSFADQPVGGMWTFHFIMPGEGQRLSPVMQGKSLQLIVNYLLSE